MKTRQLLLPFVALASLGLAACGDAPEDSTSFGQSSPAAVAAPLLDDEGRAAAPASAGEPADAGARTRTGLYASEAQARQLEASLGNRALSTQVEASANMSEAADLAVLTVYGLQAAHDLDMNAPVLVRGQDQRLAATVVNRLQANGFTRVFLVTR